ncbi:MAG TPA: PxKF domain-containing protein [Actinomycetes bacterium]|nr:PxKF domain-containing protein [Actinomycetes bacterium]
MTVAAVRRRLGHAFMVGAVVALGLTAAAATPAVAVSTGVVVSQVYGGGGNSGAPFANDFVELFNRGTAPASLAGWSVQYTSATGTGNFGANAGQLTPLPDVTLAPGEYLLVQEASGGTAGAPLPAPDVTDDTPINLAAGSGKVALVETTTPLGCNGGSTPCPPDALAHVVDLVGYGDANFFEGPAAAPAAGNTTAVLRGAGGCAETDDNRADFTAVAPNPRSTASPHSPCPTGQPVVADCGGPLTTAEGTAATTQVRASDADDRVVSIAVGGVTPTPAPGSVTLGNLVPAPGPGGTATADVTVDAATPAGTYAVAVTAANDAAEPQTGTCTLTVNVLAATTINQIQGTAHLSPRNGDPVAGVTGVVTARAGNGFYLQDPNPDTNPATSDALFVFTSAAPTVAVGDAVTVSGQVAEFRPGGSGGTTNLTTTEITGPQVTVVSSGNPLPAATVVGSGGRVPPGEVIDDDASGNVETSGTFDPASDGIDFYESLEAMRVQLNDAVAVGPTSDFGEVPVVGDAGANAGVRTARGGVVVRPGDFNPERLHLDDQLTPTPVVNVGDRFPGALVGVIDYSFGNFKLYPTSTPTAAPGGLAREATSPAGTNQVSIGTFNVENLDPGDPPAKFAELATLIVDNLKAPDIVAVEEIQDNNGATNDAVTDANLTFARLITAIQAAGGPTYDFRQINPVDDQDGGEPGGNIRVGFLFRGQRGLEFVDRPGGTPTAATTVEGSGADTRLSFSPGRIDPANTAFANSRKPLAGEFRFNGHRLFVVANHFNSKGGDQPLFGRFQPPERVTEVQRNQQAEVVHDFVADLDAADPAANVVVLGDLNDFEFSTALATLEGDLLHTLIETLPQNQRYTYDFEGNSQSLDHILVSDALFARPFSYDVVHVNAEFADQASDHDPQVVRVTLNDPPAVDAGGPYQAPERGSVAVTATGGDPEDGPLSYAWDLDGNGSFETPGQTATFSARNLRAPATRTVRVRVTDDGGLTATDTATVNVIWNFTGFFQPVDNPPVLNVLKAGRAVPVRFSLDGFQGLGISAPGHPRSEPVACDATQEDAIEETVPALVSVLLYNPVSDRYTFVWKTSGAWAGTCRRLVIKLDDGTTHTADFRFTG